MNDNQQWPCRVCGFDRGFDAWGGDENLNFSYDICACCGAEAGIEDVRLDSVRCYRKKWIDGGFTWFDPSSKPSEWSFEKQMSQIPDNWL